MSAGKLSSLSQVIPTLTGTDSFVKWRRALTMYLLDKGSLRVLEGREKEPFRRDIDPTIIGDALIIRPPGEYAGAEQPCAFQSTTGNALDAAQKGSWDEWEKKERKARATILLTVSDGIACEIEHMWSAYEMYIHIQAEHKLDTFERRAIVSWRIQSLRLRTGASADQMDDHYEAFTDLISEAMAAGLHLEDWDKCERFLLSLSNDLEVLHLRFRLMPSTERTWRNLRTAYKNFADTRRMEQEHDATVAAIFPESIRLSSKTAATGKPPTRGGTQTKYRDKTNGGGGGRGEPDGSRTGKPKCGWCGIPGHTEVECRKKQRREPSRAQITEAE